MTGESSSDGLFLSLCQGLSVDEGGGGLLPTFLILPRDLLRSLLCQKVLARRPLRFHLEFVDEVSVNPVVLTQGFRVIGKVQCGNLLPDAAAILRAFGAALAGGPDATSVCAPIDVERGDPAVRFQTLVTNPKAEGLAVISRRLVVEPCALIPRFRDDRVAQGEPVMHQFVGAGFFNLLPQAVDHFKAAIQFFAALAGVVLELFIALPEGLV